MSPQDREGASQTRRQEALRSGSAAWEHQALVALVSFRAPPRPPVPRPHGPARRQTWPPARAWGRPDSHAPHPAGRGPDPPTCDGSPDLPGRLLTHLDGGLLAVPGRMRGADQVGRILQGALAKAAQRSEAKGQSLILAGAHPSLNLSDLLRPSLTAVGRVSTGDMPSPLQVTELSDLDP